MGCNLLCAWNGPGPFGALLQYVIFSILLDSQIKKWERLSSLNITEQGSDNRRIMVSWLSAKVQWSAGPDEMKEIS